MKKIRVMLASRPKMLSDVMRNIINRQPDMILIGDVIDPIKLLGALRDRIVDVVIITPMEANGEPKICLHLLAEYPLLIIMIISAKGNVGYMYQTGADKELINEPSANLLLVKIRSAFHQITK
jgi:chemotaxis response regulator CheB